MKQINYLAQTGALEDWTWSIMNDAETEAHADRYISSLERDKKFSKSDEEIFELEEEIKGTNEFIEKVREARYLKTKIALSIAQKSAEKEQNSKFSCMFKHQLLSMAEARDAKAATLDEELQESAKKAYELTVNNSAFTIAKFLGLKIESCMACLFEKYKIERKELKNENRKLR